MAVQDLFRTAPGRITLNQAYLVYQPSILGGATLRFFDRKQDISEQQERLLLAAAPDQLNPVDWGDAIALSIPLGRLEQRPAQVPTNQGPFFAPVPEGSNSPAELGDITRGFEDWLYYNSQLTLLAHPEFGVIQRPDETQQQFRLRLRHAVRERRDEQVDDLRSKYAVQIQKVEAKLRRQERLLEQDKSDYSARKRESLIATGEMLLTFLTRRRLYRTVSWTASRRRLAQQANMELEESRQELEDMEAELSELQEELERDIRGITPKWVDVLKGLASYTIRPRRSDVQVKIVGIVWVPAWLIGYSSSGQTLTTTMAAHQSQWGT
jgi:hypothetical protein